MLSLGGRFEKPPASKRAPKARSAGIAVTVAVTEAVFAIPLPLPIMFVRSRAPPSPEAPHNPLRLIPLLPGLCPDFRPPSPEIFGPPAGDGLRASTTVSPLSPNNDMLDLTTSSLRSPHVTSPFSLEHVRCKCRVGTGRQSLPCSQDSPTPIERDNRTDMVVSSSPYRQAHKVNECSQTHGVNKHPNCLTRCRPTDAPQHFTRCPQAPWLLRCGHPGFCGHPSASHPPTKAEPAL